MNRTLIAITSLLLVATSATAAWAQKKGSSMFAIELTTGIADLADATSTHGFPGYHYAYRVPELGIQAAYWRLLSDDYALTLAAGVGFSREKNEPGTGAPTGALDQTLKTSSFNVRVGGDRVVRVGVRAIMYGGPGIEFWTGKAKYEDHSFAPSASYEGQSTKRFGLNSRVGAIMTLNKSVGLTTHVGHRIGIASADEDGAKTSWWPTSFEGSMGVVFTFGEQQ